jgi:hypothetical protein
VISSGSIIDIPKIVKSPIYSINSENAQKFYLASKGEDQAFKWILDNMGLSNQSKILTEFKDLLLDRNAQLSETAYRLGIESEYVKVLEHFVSLLIK